MLLSTGGYPDLDVSAQVMDLQRILETKLLKSHLALCKFLTLVREVTQEQSIQFPLDQPDSWKAGVTFV